MERSRDKKRSKMKKDDNEGYSGVYITVNNSRRENNRNSEKQKRKVNGRVRENDKKNVLIN